MYGLPGIRPDSHLLSSKMPAMPRTLVVIWMELELPAAESRPKCLMAELEEAGPALVASAVRHPIPWVVVAAVAAMAVVIMEVVQEIIIMEMITLMEAAVVVVDTIMGRPEAVLMAATWIDILEIDTHHDHPGAHYLLKTSVVTPEVEVIVWENHLHRLRLEPPDQERPPLRLYPQSTVEAIHKPADMLR